MTIGEIDHDEQFILLPQGFSSLFNYYTFLYRDFEYFCRDVHSKLTSVSFLHTCVKGLTYSISSCLLINPFPHINAFWRLWSRQLFENIVTKEEIAQNVQFLLLSQCFPLFVIGYPFNYVDFLCFDKSRLLQNCRMRKRVNK